MLHGHTAGPASGAANHPCQALLHDHHHKSGVNGLGPQSAQQDACHALHVSEMAMRGHIARKGIAKSSAFLSMQTAEECP